MRLADVFLITLLCVTITSIANAKELSWSVRISDDSPFASLTACDGDDDVLSIVCLKTAVTDGVDEQYNRLMWGMKDHDRLAIIIYWRPDDGGEPYSPHLEIYDKGVGVARMQLTQIPEFEPYFTVSKVADALAYLSRATTFKIVPGVYGKKPLEVDVEGILHNDFAAMAREYCGSGVVSALEQAIAPVAGGSIAESVDWKMASGWNSAEGDFVLLRHWSENGHVTQLLGDSEQHAATLTTLDKKLAASPQDDFLIDAGNRYFFRAPHNAKSNGVAAMTHEGDLSILTTEDSFARSVGDAASMGDGWILAADGIYHLSANDELSKLSATPAYGPSVHLVSVGDRVIYVDRHPEYGVELFATDGTEKGTGILFDINDKVYGQGRTRDSDPKLEHAARIGNRAVFTAIDASIPSGNSYHLWSTDGTAEGTQRLPTDGFYPTFSNFIEFEGRLYVTARSHTNGKDVLYSTDGTPEGTRALASAQGLVKVAGGDPERAPSRLGEPTRVGNRLIIPLLRSPLGLERGNPLFAVSPNGELTQLSETSVGIGDFSGHLRQTGLSAGGMLLFAVIETKDSTTFKGKTTRQVIRAVNPDSGDSQILYEMAGTLQKIEWLRNSPRPWSAADRVLFSTASAGGRNLIVTDGTIAGTHSLSEIDRPNTRPGKPPAVAAFAVGNKRIVYMEHKVFYTFDPAQGGVEVLFDPVSGKGRRPGDALLGTVRLR